MPNTEVNVMSVWPSIGAGPWGRWLGRWFAIRWGFVVGGVPITLGWLLVLGTIPLTTFLYFNKIVPRIPLIIFGFRNPSCRRYRLTNYRVVIDYPFGPHEFRSIGLNEFDTAELEVRPGHQWFRAADIVFRKGPSEVFRLAGIPHAEAFRQTCMKTKRAYRGPSPTAEPVSA